MADAAQPEVMEVSATAAKILLPGLIAELGDAAQDDVIEAQDFANAGSSGEIDRECSVPEVAANSVFCALSLDARVFYDGLDLA